MNDERATGTPGRDTPRRDSTPEYRGAVVSRRHTLITAATTVSVALAGCAGGGGGGDGGDAPAAVTLTEDDTCDMCGMVVPNHPGPSSEIFYPDREPNGHPNPARFDSTWEAFEFDFAREDWTREAFYVTDYSSVDYEIRSDGGQKLISTHPEREAFVDAAAVTFVVGSEVVGSMGKDLIGFSDSADAEAFHEDHGGELATMEEVTPTMVGSLGM